MFLASTSLTMVLAIAAPQSTLADPQGGSGGGLNGWGILPGGGGGGYPTSLGGNGVSNGGNGTPGAGGGGGVPFGAAGTGGHGTAGYLGAGGNGGAGGNSFDYTANTAPTAGSNGGDGGDDQLGGGGGGGGAGGYTYVTGNTNVTGPALAGGKGGNGGTGGDNDANLGGGQGGNGGGGGSGGAGLVVSGSSPTVTIMTSVTGGAGGAGGAAGHNEPRFSNSGGSGGVGGSGVDALTGSTINIGAGGSAIGGAGGAGGARAGDGNNNTAGADGHGGAGIRGSNLTVNLTGNATVSGGQAGGGGAQYFALQFTGGSNQFSVAPTATINGGIDITGSLTMDQPSGSVTINNVISGTGSFIKQGGNALTLGGNNTYQGGTSLFGGVLSVSADANLGAAGSGLTFNNGTLDTTASFNSNRTITLDGAGAIGVDIANTLGLNGPIGGIGTLIKYGAGTLTLGGVNSYGGGTTVTAGTLIGNTSSIKGDIANAGTVVFDQTGNDSFAGNIADYNGTNGTMTKRGAGELTLAGTSSLNWTIEAGGLVAASDRFGGNAAIGPGTSLTFDQTTDGTYAGVLSGSGNFVKTGSGAALLTGNSSGFSGTTNVSNGSLLVGDAGGNGKLGGVINVASNAILGGTGDLGSVGSAVTINAGGVHAPGSSQAVLGDYVNHGTLQIAAGPTAANKVVAAGAVDITGATLDLVLSPANAAGWNAFNGPFTIIDKQSAGVVTGTFNPVTKNLLFLDTRVAYDGGDGNDVTLQLIRNDLSFGSLGRTRNQRATGAAIATLGSGNLLWRTIALNGDPNSVRASFDALSGEIHASAKTALIEDSRFVRNAINDRIRAAFDAPGASHAPALAYASMDAPMAVSPDHAGRVFWSYGFGSWGSVDSDGNAAPLKRSTGGLLIGTDGFVGDWRIGLMTGYSHSRFNASDRFSSGDSDNYHFGAYGGTQWGNLAFRSGLAYTWHELDTRRAVAIPGFSDNLSTRYNAGTTQVFGELGYGMAAAGARFEPFANLAYVNLHTGDYAERGGMAALTGRSDTTGVTFTTEGLRAETGLPLWNTLTTLRGMLGWRHAFGDTIPTVTQAFAGSNAFTVAGVPIAKDSAVFEAGLDINVSPNATLGLAYEGQFASHADDQGFKANLAVKF
jgi:outer membrane autotransporter protein